MNTETFVHKLTLLWSWLGIQHITQVYSPKMAVSGNKYYESKTKLINCNLLLSDLTNQTR